MKKKQEYNNYVNLKLLFCIITIFLSTLNFGKSFASTEINDVSNSDIIDSQMESLNISGFINEADEYTKDVFSNTDMGELLNSAISGQVDNKEIMLSIWNLFGKEFTSSATAIGSIIVIIVIHSIIKSISDGFENKSVSRCNILCAIHINCNNNNVKLFRCVKYGKRVN